MEPAIKKNPCEFPLQKKFTDRKMLSGGFWKQNADILLGSGALLMYMQK
jgi:hypothetical protein